MSAQDRLFEDGGPLIAFRDRPVSKRTEEMRRRMRQRLGEMHARHGHGAEALRCGGCVHLVAKTGWRGNGGKRFLKCELYATDGYEGTDWQRRWPACGLFTAPPATAGG